MIMSQLPKNFDFTKLKGKDVEQKGKDVKYTFKSNLTLTGHTVVPQDSEMAAMVVTRRFDKGMVVDGVLFPKYSNPKTNFKVPERLEFIAEGGMTNNGTHYNGDVLYTLNIEDDLLKEQAQQPSEPTVVHLRTQKQKNLDLLVKVGIGAASVGVGYSLAKALKVKPIIPMIVTPLVVYGALIALDLHVWNKATSSSEEKN